METRRYEERVTLHETKYDWNLCCKAYVFDFGSSQGTTNSRMCLDLPSLADETIGDTIDDGIHDTGQVRASEGRSPYLGGVKLNDCRIELKDGPGD